MSKFAKSSLTVDGNSVHLSMPFAKVDEEKRTVSGYATLDNIDSQGDVVTAEASRAAFARARGNLREMHDKIAVGRIVDFREDEFYDTETQKFYRGIFVTAYVSEGAENTWLKVLDGTLSGFSIGGEINDASSEFVKEAGRTVRFIKDYDLVELSLVDNPANQLANVHSIQKSVFSIDKSATGSVTVKGMVADTVIENVFICKEDDTIVVKASESETCPMCSTKMENAGWFESGADRAEKVSSIVKKFLSPSETEAAPNHSEGGVEMAKGEKKETEGTQVSTPANEGADDTPDANPVGETETDPQVAEGTEEESADVDEAEGTEETEKSVEVDEVEDDEETAIVKKIDELKETVHESLDKVKTETAEAVSNLEKRIAEATNEFTSKASELEDKFNEFGQKLEAAKARQSELEKALAAINASDAVKKSADVDEPAETVQKSKTVTWGKGTFSGDSLFR